MNIVIRVDASINVGTGHCYRMLTLAHELERRGHGVIFFCRRLHGNLISKIKKEFMVVELKRPSGDISLNHNYLDWLEVEYGSEISEVKKELRSLDFNVDRLIVDHYSIDYEWHRELGDFVGNIIQIDDLDNRVYDCDVIIDQNFYYDAGRYSSNTSEKTLVFCGPEYAMLRNTFAEKRMTLQSYQRRFASREVVVFFGGIDAGNETEKFLESVVTEDFSDKFNVILGKNNPNRKSLLKRFSDVKSNFSFHVEIDNIEEIFARSYLFIGAVGATTWERCVLGLPGIVVAVAENQIESAEALNNLGAHCYLGLSEDVCGREYASVFQSLKNDCRLLESQSKKCSELTDGLGVRRVADIIEKVCHESG